MVKVLRKVIEKRVDCPKCGCELSFDDSDERYYWSRSEGKYICCICGCYITTRDGDGNISQNVTLITEDVNEEKENAED